MSKKKLNMNNLKYLKERVEHLDGISRTALNVLDTFVVLNRHLNKNYLKYR